MSVTLLTTVINFNIFNIFFQIWHFASRLGHFSTRFCYFLTRLNHFFRQNFKNHFWHASRLTTHLTFIEYWLEQEFKSYQLFTSTRLPRFSTWVQQLSTRHNDSSMTFNFLSTWLQSQNFNRGPSHSQNPTEESDQIYQKSKADQIRPNLTKSDPTKSDQILPNLTKFTKNTDPTKSDQMTSTTRLRQLSIWLWKFIPLK